MTPSRNFASHMISIRQTDFTSEKEAVRDKSDARPSRDSRGRGARPASRCKEQRDAACYNNATKREEKNARKTTSLDVVVKRFARQS